MDCADAVDVLRLCISPAGLKASGYSTGHQQVWARDSMIALLGARFASDESVHQAFLRSLDVLRRHQTTAGAIPNNVDCATQQPNFRAYADSGLWWIVGSSLLDPNSEVSSKILAWYECQDVDRTGLISMQEAADWQDLFCTRGKGLYLNCLYVMALRAAGRSEDAGRVAQRINEILWYRGDGDLLPHIAHSFSTVNAGRFDSLGRERWIPKKKYLPGERFYLPYVGFRAVGEWFDTLGNLLAILAGVANETRTSDILNLIETHGVDAAPVRSLTPVIQPGDSDWREYYGDLNTPHRYHNGGVWPFIGGFYVAALVKAGKLSKASAVFERLTELNRAGEFNEWHHGETLEPLGVRAQAWSAGMYLYAAECIKRATLPSDPFFG